ncbi:MAG: hypothetical protein Q4F41_09280 [Eubacteriales bacterium]|nr:hypothetical protein [Eubacteriales bacterium]
MKKRKNTWKCGLILGILLVWICGLQVFAEGLSGDNSLYTLGIENGTVEPEFYYSTVEYTVTVSPGTTELILNPVCSNSNAQIVSIDGTTLDNGSGTVTITVEAQNGVQAVYTLHVQPDPTAETEAPTEPQTEAPQTEPETEDATITFLTGQVSQFREKLDFSMKVIYGLIALAVLLMFVSINLILKNRDLKDDLRDAEDRLDLQTNEFARKEKMMDTDNYYAPVQQTAQPEKEPKAAKGSRKKAKAQAAPEEEAPAEEAPAPTPAPAPAPKAEEPVKPVSDEPEAPAEEAAANPEEEDVDVTMVEL